MKPANRPNHALAHAAIVVAGSQLPPLTNFGDVIVECPHCTAEMMPEAVGRLNARAEVVSAAASRMAELHAPPRRSGLQIMLVVALVGLGLVTAFVGGAFFEMTLVPVRISAAERHTSPADRRHRHQLQNLRSRCKYSCHRCVDQSGNGQRRTGKSNGRAGGCQWNTACQPASGIA